MEDKKVVDGTIDNMIMMRSVIDNNRRLNRKKTYYYFADVYKCFDKLCLEDCLVENWNEGDGSIHVIYEMNKESNMVIETPV